MPTHCAAPKPYIIHDKNSFELSFTIDFQDIGELHSALCSVWKQPGHDFAYEEYLSELIFEKYNFCRHILNTRFDKTRIKNSLEEKLIKECKV